MKNLILPLLLVTATANADPATDARTAAFARCTAFVFAATTIVDEPQSSVLRAIGDEFIAKGRKLDAELFDDTYNTWADTLTDEEYRAESIRDGAMFCVKYLK